MKLLVLPKLNGVYCSHRNGVSAEGKGGSGSIRNPVEEVGFGRIGRVYKAKNCPAFFSATVWKPRDLVFFSLAETTFWLGVCGACVYGVLRVCMDMGPCRCD